MSGQPILYLGQVRSVVPVGGTDSMEEIINGSVGGPVISG